MPAVFIIYVIIFSHIGINIMRAVIIMKLWNILNWIIINGQLKINAQK